MTADEANIQASTTLSNKRTVIGIIPEEMRMVIGLFKNIGQIPIPRNQWMNIELDKGIPHLFIHMQGNLCYNESAITFTFLFRGD
jgi:hypothetical protein